MANKPRLLFNVLSILYPAVVFFLLIVLKLPIRIFSLCIIVFLVGFIGVATVKHKQEKKRAEGRILLVTSLLFFLMAGSFITNSSTFLRLYSFFVNIGMLCIFFASLFSSESIIYRFATMAQPSIRQSITRDKVKGYCWKVTVIWCCFFVLNGSVSFWTAIFASEKIWAIYNGCISYILMGTLFAGEFIVRVIVQKSMEKEVPLSQVTGNSRPDDTILCYEGNWSKGNYKTWKDFVLDTAKLRAFINQRQQEQWLLHCEDAWLFLVAFAALLQCKKTILITANISPSFLQEIWKDDTFFLTDRLIPNATSIEELLIGDRTGSDKELEIPSIHPDETKIILYTSGSTGQPKAVQQRLTEFELDNRFILSQWGTELIKRKLCTTVSHHHIYGLLFSIMLPFTAGVPFRRTRIEQPEEFLALIDTSYMIIAVPAFLKRANQLELSLQLEEPWIFTSGGVLSSEEAERTNRGFGFWPVEVYGSTETSGIAWRCSKNGVQWKPFDNAEITLTENGCLKVRSPYIKSPDGFVTGDLAQILDDGTFILKGRADSIVKIEEKRISTTEIENRLLQTGLVQEAVVVPLKSTHRQSLGAVVVLNKAGKERFEDCPKLEINGHFKNYLAGFFEPVVLPRKWRFPEAIPLDTQGKRSWLQILSLFEKKDLFTIHSKQVKTDSATIEFSVPSTSPYFDGHFADFPILPAVAQVTIALKLASECFGISTAPNNIKKIKFSNMILPEKRIRLTLNLSTDGKTLSVKMDAPQDSSMVYSQGTIKLGDA